MARSRFVEGWGHSGSDQHIVRAVCLGNTLYLPCRDYTASRVEATVLLLRGVIRAPEKVITAELSRFVCTRMHCLTNGFHVLNPVDRM